MVQFPEIPVTVISNFHLKFLCKSTTLFQILQKKKKKKMIFSNTTNTTYRFSFKQNNLFYTVQKHEIWPFMETLPHDTFTFLQIQIRVISKTGN